MHSRSIPGLFPLLLTLAPVAAQTRHVVDASGKVGKFKTISAAIATAKSGDFIQVENGQYNENLLIDGKALTIYSASGDPSRVIVSRLSWNGLTIRNHPARSTTRLTGFTILAAYYNAAMAIRVENGAGDIVLDKVHTDAVWEFYNHKGSVFASSCRLRAPNRLAKHILSIEYVTHASFHSCLLTGRLYSGYLTTSGAPGVLVDTSSVEFTGCSMRGGEDTITVQYYPPGPGLLLMNSKARLTGTAQDIIQSGASFASVCASGIVLNNSTLDWSGVTIKNNGGTCPAIRVGPISRATKVAPPHREGTPHGSDPARAGPGDRHHGLASWILVDVPGFGHRACQHSPRTGRGRPGSGGLLGARARFERACPIQPGPARAAAELHRAALRHPVPRPGHPRGADAVDAVRGDRQSLSIRESRRPAASTVRLRPLQRPGARRHRALARGDEPPGERGAICPAWAAILAKFVEAKTTAT